MFSLIISIISIALVAALAAATVYFGGAAFNKGAAGADASAFINAGQQIAGAFTLAATDGDNAATIAELTNVAVGTEVYLAQEPSYKGVLLVLDGATGYAAAKVTAGVCLEIVKKNGGNSVGSLAAPTGLFGCATPTAAGNLITASVTTDNVAFYKVK